MGEWIANARMYAVAPGAAAAWRRLFQWLDGASGVRLTVIDHAFPAVLNDLWDRTDLACAFMCGWPWLRRGGVNPVLAAPVPTSAYAEGRPQYCTHFVVHADSPFRTLEDTFAHRFAYTIADSHSGYNAPRHHLLRYRTPERPRLFGEIVGPLTTPRRMLEAINEGRTDVGPLDAFAFDLLARHEPALTRHVRIVASTAPMPIPSLVASPGAPASIIEPLRSALLAFGASADQAELRAELRIAGFAPLDPASYGLSETWAKAAETAGLEVIT